ncbi:MAG: DNA translocase FtsK 4TM domain-containing protein [Methylococcales bacterium]
MSEPVSHGSREIVLVGFIAVALYLLVSLYSFHLDDAGWTHTGTGQTLHNAGGSVGAWLADFLLSFLGILAYMIPSMLIYQGWLYARKDPADNQHWLILLRWFGLLMTIAIGATLLYLHFRDLGNQLPHSAGGILGREVGESFADAFGIIGATILLIAAFAAAINLLSGLSWLSLIDAIGKYILLGFDTLSNNKTDNFKTPPTQSKPRIRSVAEIQREKSAKSGQDYFSALAPGHFESTNPDLHHQKRPVHAQTAEQLFNDEDTNIFLANDSDVDDLLILKQEEALHFDEPKEILSNHVENIESSPAQQEPTLQTPSLRIPTQTDKSNEPEAVSKPSENSRPSRKMLPRGTIPPLDELDSQRQVIRGYSKQNLDEMADKVEQILGEFGVKANVKEVHPGPVITRFELELAPGTKASRVTGLSKDLARALLVQSVRVVEVIPGKPLIGLEIPNTEREMVTLKDVLASREYQREKSVVTIALGKDISGQPVVTDLAKMPHLLVAGTTGSGKSVAINAMILSLLYKAGPDQIRMIMVDPKMLELSVYEDIPHLLTPVVTDMKLASQALRWCVAEMERRYKLMSMLGVRNLAGFNQKVTDAMTAGTPIKDPLFEASEGLDGIPETPSLEPLPIIVIIIDELADMMMIVGKKVEQLIARLAQKARAAGLHLILATQRPSVDVLTGLIKANVPTRIAFQVSSKIDSRTILDQGGAETLLGNGDMLYLPPGTSMPIRAHGAFVSDQEVHRVVEFLKRTGRPEYISSILEPEMADSGFEGTVDGQSQASDQDALYDQAVDFVTQSRKASISSVQRKFRIGYNRAARIIEEMENTGVVSPAETNGSRQVLAPPAP